MDRDGLPLFWNEQPSAPRLGPTSGLYYYDGQRLPRPWKDPPVEWGAGPALYPHVPEGCGDQCQKIPLNAVRGFITCVRLRSMQEKQGMRLGTLRCFGFIGLCSVRIVLHLTFLTSF